MHQLMGKTLEYGLCQESFYCLIFSFVSGVAEVRSDAISFHNFFMYFFFFTLAVPGLELLCRLFSGCGGVGFSLQWPLLIEHGL